ncbi:MAG: hypothetical protein ABFS16_10215 [Bacteroidota bacterium]
MKTKTWVLTALACLIVAIGFATDFPKMNVVPVEAEKALVAFESVEPSPLEITLTTDDGEILYFKRTEKRCTEYKKIFNFSELGEGNYCVCINFGNRSIARKVDVTKDDIKVGPPQRLYEPYFCMKGDKLNVSFLNCSQKQVYVNIYREGQHVTGVKLGKDLAIQKCLDFSKLESGEYEIVLTDCFKDHKYIAQL